MEAIFTQNQEWEEKQGALLAQIEQAKEKQGTLRDGAFKLQNRIKVLQEDVQARTAANTALKDQVKTLET